MTTSTAQISPVTFRASAFHDRKRAKHMHINARNVIIRQETPRIAAFEDGDINDAVVEQKRCWEMIQTLISNDPVVALAKELIPVFMEAWSNDNSHKSVRNRATKLLRRMYTSVARTPEGVLAQFLCVRIAEDFGDINVKWIAGIEAGLKSLQSGNSAKSAPIYDPVIAIAERERHTKGEWLAQEEKINGKSNPEWEKTNEAWTAAAEEFWDTPALSLEGLYLQVKDIASYEHGNYETVLTGIENILNQQKSGFTIADTYANTDPVFYRWQQFKRTRQAYYAASEEEDIYKKGDSSEHAVLKEKVEQCSGRYDEAEDALFTTEATTPYGIQLQISVIKEMMDGLVFDDPDSYLKPIERVAKCLQFKEKQGSPAWEILEILKNEVAEIRISQRVEQAKWATLKH